MSFNQIVVVPGNGGGGDTSIRESNWYGWLEDQLKDADICCVVRDMPDPYYARASIWLPFMESELKCDEETVIVGHSSGAVAAMRYCEDHQVAGIVLVAAYSDHLGDEMEKASGYFDKPWQWDRIRANAGWIVQFSSQDDGIVPFNEQVVITEQLQTDSYVHTDRGHFCSMTFPELVKVLQEKRG